jgi:hypothetical protein
VPSGSRHRNGAHHAPDGGLAELAQERRRPKPPKPLLPKPRRPPRSPDRQASMLRRRRLSAAGMMPPGLAAHFTVGEQAALAVVATEVKLRGQCDLYTDQIAAFAGVGRSTVKNATRKAKGLNLLTIEEWKQAPDWNGPNRIRIVALDWTTWLAHHHALKMTVKPLTTTRNQYLKRPATVRGYRRKRLGEEGYRPSAWQKEVAGVAAGPK